MQQVRNAKVEPEVRRSDPAPSRLNYRIERLMLTPLVRFSVRVVLPLSLIAAVAGLWYGQADNRNWVAGQISAAKNMIHDRPEFQVKMMAIDGASSDLAGEIRTALPVSFPISSFDLDLDAMRMALSELPPVKAARLRVNSGGVLQIEIEERVPAVLWRQQAGLTLLDGAGMAVRSAKERALHPDLPVVAGEGAQEAVSEALELFAVMGPLLPRLRGFERRGARRWDVVLDRGQRIMLPPEEAAQALRRVIAMDQAKDLLNYDLAVVDLRLRDRATLRLNEVGAGTYRQTIKTKAGGTP